MTRMSDRLDLEVLAALTRILDYLDEFTGDDFDQDHMINMHFMVDHVYRRAVLKSASVRLRDLIEQAELETDDYIEGLKVASLLLEFWSEEEE